ncbi:MAG: DUF429 domain-containing protein [Burkholderiales bacterium]|nr:DUF429 domain-containing protein [Burkholderiales bacterium]
MDALPESGGERYVGLDGCRGGWFCVGINDQGNWVVSLIAGNAVFSAVSSARTALIDIPIGLGENGSGARLCDREARRQLGRMRGASVFPAPTRASLRARNYSEALAINRRQTGRGISKQSWLLAPKIREIDDLLQAELNLRGVLRESHPEVCFWALNGSMPMRHNKKTLEGRNERLALLRLFFPATDALYKEALTRYRRTDTTRDDIIDALVLAISARFGAGRYSTLPARPPRDANNLPMEMVFWAP